MGFKVGDWVEFVKGHVYTREFRKAYPEKVEILWKEDDYLYFGDKHPDLCYNRCSKVSDYVRLATPPFTENDIL